MAIFDVFDDGFQWSDLGVLADRAIGAAPGIAAQLGGWLGSGGGGSQDPIYNTYPGPPMTGAGGAPMPQAPAPGQMDPNMTTQGNALQVLQKGVQVGGQLIRDPRIQALVGLAGAGTALLSGGDEIEDLFGWKVHRDKCGNETTRRHVQSGFQAVDEETGRTHFYRNMGQPVLYSGDLAACRRVERAACRASDALKRSSSRKPRRRRKTTRRRARRCPAPAAKRTTRKRTTRKGQSSAQAKARALFAQAARKHGGKIPKGTDLGRPGPRI